MDNKKSFLASVSVHLVILGLLSFNVVFSPSKQKPTFTPLAIDKPIIQAGVISKSVVENAVKRQQQEEQKRITDLQKQQQQIQQAKKEVEQQKTQAKREVAQAKKIQQEVLKSQALAKQQEQEIIKKKQELAKKQQDIQQEQVKLKQIAEQQKLQVLRQAEAANKQAALDAAANAAANAAAKASELEHYMGMIHQQIEANRTLSSAFGVNLFCQIGIKLLPDGTVHSVRVLKSSGNPAYDENSEIAVHKAAPFNMPKDPELIGQLRDITIGFRNDQEIS